MSVKMECKKCRHQEELNARWFFNALGSAMAAMGPAAWITYLFAGTGFALPICAAILAGGVIMLKYSDEIALWLNSNYKCPGCNHADWRIINE